MEIEPKSLCSKIGQKSPLNPLNSKKLDVTPSPIPKALPKVPSVWPVSGMLWL